MNEYCWFFSFAVHHFRSQPTQHSEAERLNLPFSATICRNDECCGGWGSIMRTQAFGGQRARSVNHSSTSISALVEVGRGTKITKVQPNNLSLTQTENIFTWSSLHFALTCILSIWILPWQALKRQNTYECTKKWRATQTTSATVWTSYKHKSTINLSVSAHLTLWKPKCTSRFERKLPKLQHLSQRGTVKTDGNKRFSSFP